MLPRHFGISLSKRQRFNPLNLQNYTETIGIASGKGGAGKSTVSVNLAPLALQEKGFRVMLFDADLGLANAPILLGTRCPFNISHVLSGEKTLAEVVVTTPQNLRLIAGASGDQTLAGLSAVQVGQLVQSFSDLPEQLDYLIVDMAAGIAPAVMTLMAACHRRFIVMRNDPSSIADAYGTIKVLLKNELMDEIYLLPNAVRNQLAGEVLFQKINRVCAQFLSRTVHYAGSIEQDSWVQDAHTQLQALMTFAPGSQAAKDFRQLANVVTDLAPVEKPSGAVQFFVNRWLTPTLAKDLH
jgi:flagellar biosynthesis protein FlhG